MAYGTHHKTEHTGAKHGRGAFYGRKQDAKLYSKRARRAGDRRLTDAARRGEFESVAS